MNLEDERRMVFEQLEQQFGTGFATALMRMVPPMNWEELATKKDLERLATKADLERFATKADLERFATKADLERFATKAELSETRAELGETRTELAETRTDVRELRFEMNHRFEMVGLAIESSKHELIGVMRGEVTSALVAQTRHVILAMTSAVVALGGIAVALARFA